MDSTPAKPDFYSKKEVDEIFKIARGMRAVYRVWPVLAGSPGITNDLKDVVQFVDSLMRLPAIAFIDKFGFTSLESKVKNMANFLRMTTYPKTNAGLSDATSAVLSAIEADVDIATIDAADAANFAVRNAYGFVRAADGNDADLNSDFFESEQFSPKIDYKELLRHLSEFLLRPLWEGSRVPEEWSEITSHASKVWAELGHPEWGERYQRYCEEGIDFEELQEWILGTVEIRPHKDFDFSLITKWLEPDQSGKLIHGLYYFAARQPKYRDLLLNLDVSLWAEAADALDFRLQNIHEWESKITQLTQSIVITAKHSIPEPNPLWVNWMRNVHLPRLRSFVTSQLADLENELRASQSKLKNKIR